jgi:hypothetical protein
MPIYLHKEHGVNPAIYDCFWCGKDMGLVLPGSRTKAFKEAGLADSSGKMKMNIGAIDHDPCDECKEYMKQGVILISVLDDDEGSKNPYRTGGFAVLKDEALPRLIEDEGLVNHILKTRVSFVPDTVWNLLGLPELPDRGEV